MSYKKIITLEELQEYLSGATHVAFDFETAPTEKYRKEDKASLDAHKSRIVGISFSVAEGDAVYLPLKHQSDGNAADQTAIWNFIAAPEGKVLLALDFSQIELRVGAFYCKDEKMLETYQTGGDIHALTTAVIYRITAEEAADKSHPDFKERRTIAKNCNFGTFFGLFPKGLQKTLKFKAGLEVDLEECEKIIRNLKHGYPRLSRWQEEIKKA